MKPGPPLTILLVAALAAAAFSAFADSSGKEEQLETDKVCALTVAEANVGPVLTGCKLPPEYVALSCVCNQAMLAFRPTDGDRRRDPGWCRC